MDSCASDWLKQNSLVFQPIRITTKIWVVMRHQYGIFALVTQTSFCEGQVATLRNVGCFLRLIEKSISIDFSQQIRLSIFIDFSFYRLLSNVIDYQFCRLPRSGWIQ